MNSKVVNMNLMRTLVALLAFCSFMSNSAISSGSCRPTVIAVLDTGFGYVGKGHDASLCKYGHKNFSIEQEYTAEYGTKDKIPLDTHGHGTNIVGIIDGYAKKFTNSYCIVVIKYYSEKQTGLQNLNASTKAIQYATNIGAKFINYSGGGPESNPEEQRAVKTFLNKGGTFVAAAGNERSDLDLPENAYYPAMDDKRVIVVGNTNFYGVRSPTSNYGKIVTRWEIGESITAYGLTMTGTSQATAVATGRILSERKRQCDIGF